MPPCNTRCRQAKSPASACRCSCAGANHGLIPEHEKFLLWIEAATGHAPNTPQAPPLCDDDDDREHPYLISHSSAALQAPAICLVYG